MEILSKLMDQRINSLNFLTEMSVEEYLSLAKKILEKNEYQRKRVKKSNTVYALLKIDLVKGCLIPPLVLALPHTNLEITNEKLKAEIQKGNLLILDGLQRTYTLIELEKELKDKQDTDSLKKLYQQKLRIEIYFGINRLGILYRMLTLNTGQTPVTLRHQIEILYLDYLISGIDNIKLIREAEDETPDKLGEYKFDDTVAGFNSYIERDELPIDRLDILENIQGLEKLSKEDQNVDLFKEFIVTYNKLVLKLNDLSEGWIFDKEQLTLDGPPFGANVQKIFARSQAMTGFGAAIGILKDRKLIENFEDVRGLMEKIGADNVSDALNSLIKKLDEIKHTSTKIGPAQRIFFQYIFRELFNKEGDSFLNLNGAIEKGYRRYQSQI